MWWQSDVEKNPCGNRVLSSLLFFLVLLSWNPFIFVLRFFIVFFFGFRGFLSSLCSFFRSSVGLFVFNFLESQIFIVFFRFFFFFFYGTRVFKTRVPCGKNISMSAIDLKISRLDFFTELEPQRLKMLFFKLLSTSC